MQRKKQSPMPKLVHLAREKIGPAHLCPKKRSSRTQGPTEPWAMTAITWPSQTKPITATIATSLCTPGRDAPLRWVTLLCASFAGTSLTTLTLMMTATVKMRRRSNHLQRTRQRKSPLTFIPLAAMMTALRWARSRRRRRRSRSRRSRRSRRRRKKKMTRKMMKQQR